MIKIQNNTASREPIPQFLLGLAPESLLDLSWTDPALGVSDCAWWPEDDVSASLTANTKYGDETLVADPVRKVVTVTRAVVPLTASEIAAIVAPQRAAFLIKVDADVDAIYEAAIGNRGPEYDQASAEANAYKTASYTGTVPASVASWAAAKGWTAQAAADDIIAAATRLAAARDAIRAQRLLRKEQAKVAADAAALAAITAQWAGFVAYIRSQLGV